MKKTLLFYVAVMFTVVTSFSQTFSSQEFNFELINGSTTDVIITGRATGNTATDITIPATATFNDTTYTVTSIGDFVFFNNALESVVIPEGVTSIGDRAFASNMLQSLVIPEGVTSIGELAFATNRLQSVVIPASVTSIGRLAFGDNMLESVVIPEGVTSIGEGAFSFNALTSVDIPASLTSIGGGAFRNNALESVVIPASVTSIGRFAFGDNPLQSVTSLSTNPATIDNDSNDPFRNLDRLAITLTIPVGTRETYITDGWAGFNIVEDVTLSTTDTSVSLKDNFVVLTNPNSISVKSSSIATINVQELAIYAVSGKKVATSTVANISTEILVNGVYLLRIVTDKGAVTKKIIK